MSWSAPPPVPLPPPGWYPDPVHGASQRRWDGARWTEHVVSVPPPAAVSVPASSAWWHPAPVPSSTVPAAPSVWPPAPARGPAPDGTRNSDGQIVLGGAPLDLAGWWRRFGGYVLDAVIVDVALLVLGAIIRRLDESLRGPLSPGLHPMTPAAQVAVVVSAVAVLLGYPLILLHRRGQTVGMMAAGVRAVDGVTGAALTSPQTWRRVLAYFGLTVAWVLVADVIGFNHVVGPQPPSHDLLTAIGAIGLIVTALWPLGSTRSQTLQDKAGGTVVVRSRG